MVQESEDVSQRAEKVSGPQNTMKRGVLDKITHGMSQLGYTLVVVTQVVEKGEFNIFGNDPSRWNHSFIALKSLCPTIDFPFWIEWSRHFRQTTVLSPETVAA